MARPRQVGTTKTNASEPLMTCRKRRNGVKTGGMSLTREKPEVVPRRCESTVPYQR